MQTILSIARFEFLMHWRGRALRVLALTMLVVTAAGMFIYQAVPEALLIGSQNTLSVDAVLTFVTFPALIVLIAFVMPVASSETIPIDKHYRTHELFNSLPVTTAQYLSGKLLGYWSAGLAALAITFVVNFTVWLIVLKNFSIVSYVELWIIAAIALILNSGIAILISGTQPNRIRAAALVIGVFMLSTLLLENTSNTLSFAALINLSRGEVISYSLNPAGTSGLRLTAPELYLSFAAGFIELALAFTLLWTWRRRAE